MKEIEVKARLTNKPALLRALAKLNIVLGEPIVQNDIVFAQDVTTFQHFSPGVNFLRLRTQNEKTILTLKKSEFNETESTEHETEVGNPEETKLLIAELGFSEAVRISKVRRKAKYQDMEICLDEVAGLGDFIEVEKLLEQGDTLAIQAELFTFLQTLGVQESDRVNQGYDTLMFIHNSKKDIP